jgi:hypothetical protein
LNKPLTFSTLDAILCLMKMPIYLTNPQETRKVRLSQPPTNSAQARRQREILRRVSEAACLRRGDGRVNRRRTVGKCPEAVREWPAAFPS